MKTKLSILLFLIALVPAFSFTTLNEAPGKVETLQDGEYVYLTAYGNKPDNYYISNIIWISGSHSSPENVENRKKVKKQFENAIASNYNDDIKYYSFVEKSLKSDSKETFEGKRTNNIREQKAKWTVLEITL